jgi:hypothetical protein
MLFQTAHATGQKATPVAYEAGLIKTVVFEHVFNEAFATATDAIELGILPAECQLVGASCIGTGLGATTCDIGIMSDPPGETDDATTVGDEIFDGVSVNDSENDATLANCLAIAPASTHRAIGAHVKADVAAGGAKKLQVRIDFISA